MDPNAPALSVDVPLERDPFLRSILRELTGTLQDVVGLEEAAGFISVVGQNIGSAIDRDYRKKKEGHTPSDHAPVIADLQ